jgi:hypothetical protein
MMKSTMPYVIRPLFLACSCLALPAGFAFGVYMLFFHQWDSLPGIIKGIAVVLLPIPFVLMQILLAKAFYYFELFGKRLAIGYGENRAILEHLIAAGEPFCLYLRNHSFENGSVIHTFQVRADREPLSRTGLVHWPVTNNAFESSVVAGIEAHLPVFAIDSPSDSSVGTARRIVVQDNHWFSEADRLIGRAALIIVNHEAQTEGILRELESIRKHKAGSRTLLFTTEAALTSLADRDPELIGQLKWLQIKRGNSIHKRLETPTVPHEVIEFAALIGNSAAVGWYHPDRRD